MLIAKFGAVAVPDYTASVAFLLILFASNVQIANAAEFAKNCTPKESAHLACYVEADACGSIPDSEDAPGPPYDVRNYQAMSAVPSRDPAPYQLGMNFSWQPPYDDSLLKIRGFEINIYDNATSKSQCFALLLDDTAVWSETDKDRLPWFSFWTKDVLDFSSLYTITVHSLPKASRNSRYGQYGNSKSLQILSPDHPEASSGPVDCSGGYAHKDASKWVAAFKTVQIFPFPRKISVEFIAAPPKYCFQAYELRLMRSRVSIVNWTMIRSSKLYHERIGNVTVAYGNHTFTNVTPGHYDLALVPIDRADDGHCLCPLPSKICTCSQAIWFDVKLPEAERPTLPDPCQHLPPARDPFLCRSGTPIPEKQRGWTTEAWLLLALLSAAALAISVSAAFLRAAYKRYISKSDILYAVPTTMLSDEVHFGPKPGPSSEVGTANYTPTRVLVIYAHDFPAHQRAVEALVAYLSVQLGPQTTFRADFLNERDISENKLDWVLGNLRAADRVLFVASYGAFIRCQTKQNEPFSRLRRRDSNPMDDLFLLQTDLLNLEGLLTSRALTIARFSYTPRRYADVSYTTTVARRFEVPKHADSLVKWLRNDAANSAPLMDWQVRDESCGEWARLKQAVADAESFMAANPDWFEKYHAKMSFVDDHQRSIAVPKAGSPRFNAKVSPILLEQELIDEDKDHSAPIILLSGKEDDPLIAAGDSRSVSTTSYDQAEAASLLLTVAAEGDAACGKEKARRQMDSSDSGICCDYAGTAYADQRRLSCCDEQQTTDRAAVAPLLVS